MNDLDLCLEVVKGYVNHCVTSPLNILESVRDRGQRLGSKGPPISNGLRGIKWLHPKGQIRDHA